MSDDKETLPLKGKELGKEEFWQESQNFAYVPSREEFDLYWAHEQNQKQRIAAQQALWAVTDCVEIDGKRFFKEEWWGVSQKINTSMTREEFDVAWEHAMREKRKRHILMQDGEVWVSRINSEWLKNI